MTMKYIVLSLSIILLYSCSKQEPINDIKKLVFNEDVNPNIFNTLTYKFIPLETNDSCLFSEIREIKIVDNKIYIIDDKRSKLLVFDISGRANRKRVIIDSTYEDKLYQTPNSQVPCGITR